MLHLNLFDVSLYEDDPYKDSVSLRSCKVPTGLLSLQIIVEDYVILDLLSNLIPSSASTSQHLAIRCNDGVFDMHELTTVFAPIERTLTELEYRIPKDTQTEEEWSEALIGTLGKFRKVRHLAFPLPIHSTRAVVVALRFINGVESITLTSDGSNKVDEVALLRFVQLMNSQLVETGKKWGFRDVATDGSTNGCLISNATAARHCIDRLVRETVRFALV